MSGLHARVLAGRVALRAMGDRHAAHPSVPGHVLAAAVGAAVLEHPGAAATDTGSWSPEWMRDARVAMGAA